jgi:hypothetical protein
VTTYTDTFSHSLLVHTLINKIPLYASYLRCSEVRYAKGIEDKTETLEKQDKEDPHERQRTVPSLLDLCGREREREGSKREK